MAQRLTTSSVVTNIPGSYVEARVKSTPVGLATTGIIAIIGEAEGGASFLNEDLKENFFSVDQGAEVVAKYISGPIVDAFRALSAPSADAQIAGSANRIYIAKTNTGTKASALIDTDYGTLSSKNYGILGNEIKYRITESQAEVTPSVTSAAIPAFGAALDGLSFSVRVNGGAATVITLSGNPANHSNVATLVTELTSLLPTDFTVTAGTAPNTIVISLDSDPANHRKGWGKSFELIDSTPGDLAALGLVENLYVSGAESNVEINIARSSTNTDETLEAKGEIALEIGYAGTTATLSIVNNTLTTTVTGGPGANLSINLNQYQTVNDLAAFISTKPGYSAVATAVGKQMKPADLDKVTAIGICSTASGKRPGRIKKSLKNFKDAIKQSAVADFEAIAVKGIPSPMSSYVFLSGGTKGATTGAAIVDALSKLEGINVNFIVPLFSRDASEDIADNLTDSGSTYTIDAIHTATKNHVLKMSQVKIKKNRIAILSFDGTYAQAAQKAQNLASYRCLMTFQKSSQVDSQGEVQMFGSWHTACIAAGMQAAGFYRAIVNKLANVISFKDPSGFDSGSSGDLEKALDAGLLILQNDTAGVRWVSDQSTYGFDTNFVYNSMQATYLSDVAALSLADSLQRQFVGQSLADIDRKVVESFVIAKMDEFRGLKIIAASDDAPLGFRGLKVKINGPIIEVQVEIKLASAVYFIPVTLEISQVQQSA
jgi:hypothetical protein